MIHISLIGDSVFDNKSYVGEAGTDVITHLRNMLPDQSKASLIANDGDVIKKVSDEQISRIPSTSTHLIISVGGNDAIMNADILNLEMGTSAEVLSEISGRQKIFENDYTEMLESLTKIGLPVISNRTTRK